MTGDPQLKASWLDTLLTVAALAYGGFALVALSNNAPPGADIALAGLVVPAVGIGKFWWLRRRVQTLQSRVETTEGTVTAAQQRTAHDFGRYGTDVCYPEITVEYSYDGAEYTTESVYPDDQAVRFQPDDIQAFLDDYEAAATTTVYVDPEDHSRAYLEPHPGWVGMQFPMLVYALTVPVGLWAVAASVLAL